MYNILVVDDEPEITGLLKIYLELQGYKVITAGDGNDAWEKFTHNSIDLVLTDIMMPVSDGYRLAERIREKSNIPIMFISAKVDIADRIKGLQMGADDYIIKPFDPMEAVTRVTANLRRYYSYGSHKLGKCLKCADLTLDTEKCCLTRSGQTVELTALEYRIIRYFMENMGRVLTKNQIYENCWEDGVFPDDNSIMVAISKLRTKLCDEKQQYIQTIRGLGYRMEAEDEKKA